MLNATGPGCIPDPVLHARQLKAVYSDEELAGVPGKADSTFGDSVLVDADESELDSDASDLTAPDLSDSLGAGLLVGELDRESLTYQPEPLNTMPVA